MGAEAYSRDISCDPGRNQALALSLSHLQPINNLPNVHVFWTGGQSQITQREPTQSQGERAKPGSRFKPQTFLV